MIYPELEIFHDSIETVLGGKPALEVVSSGYRFLEGPVWIDQRKTLYFSDIPGNGIYAWKEDTGAELFKPNSYLANGNTFDGDRSLITCEHGTSRITKTDLDDGTYTVLTDSYNGRRLNSPNDIVVHENGNVYFTDPDAGRQPRVGIPRPRELDFNGVYMYDRKTSYLYLIEDTLVFPNGLCFSPDFRRLYINDSRQAIIAVYDLDEKGMLKNRRTFAKIEHEGPGVLDGMKCRSDGTIFCAGPSGLYIISAGGRVLGRIHTPEITANFCFGRNENELFLAATSTVYRLEIK